MNETTREIHGLPEMPAPVRRLLMKVSGRPYLPAGPRLMWFRAEHPDWGIKTENIYYVDEPGVCVMHCDVTADDGRHMASGTKRVTRKDFADFVEKAETGAISRALGALGYCEDNSDEFRDALDDGDGGQAEPRAAASNGHQQRDAEISDVCFECGVGVAPAVAKGTHAAFGQVYCQKHRPVAGKAAA